VVKQRMHLRLKVRAVATRQGIDRARLSRMADLNYQTVHDLWRNPDKPVSMTTLVKLARALGVEVTELYEEVED
jgi:DNA-binding Xre family transcriptional regulator